MANALIDSLNFAHKKPRLAGFFILLCVLKFSSTWQGY